MALGDRTVDRIKVVEEVSVVSYLLVSNFRILLHYVLWSELLHSQCIFARVGSLTYYYVVELNQLRLCSAFNADLVDVPEH